MATKELKAKYGEGNTRHVVNRAIRAELLGGAALIEARTWFHKNQVRNKNDIVAVIDDAIFEMDNEIRRRYDMNQL